MLEHLTPQEFEEYCQLLLNQHFRCKVELTKQTGDEGRDLLVHRSTGLEVVECKHWPDGTVGRPVVQKLHSAILTANSTRGMIITTGRFSTEAATYADNLNDVRIELVDAAKLAYLASVAFPNGALPTNLCAGIKTTADADFRQVFPTSILSKRRYYSGTASATPVHVTRATRYETFFIAIYQAEGSVNTAVGEFSESWNGSVWVSADGDMAGFGSPRSRGRKLGSLVPLAEVLRAVPGQTTPPKLQPHQAVAGMKDFIINHCIKRHSYRGRNNVSYSATIQPSPTTIAVDSLKLCYIPVQEFVLEIGTVRYAGGVDERGTPTQFLVECPSLSKCTVCQTATTADNQVFCSICFRPAHRWGVFSPDSFNCGKCRATVCRTHTVRFGRTYACTRCGGGGRTLGPRWVGHCQIGLATSTLILLLTAISSACLIVFGSDGSKPVTFAVVGIGLSLGLVAWLPFIWMLLQPSVRLRHDSLTYPMLKIQEEPTKRPDWLYGKTN
jgi:restriction system protein